MKEAAKVVMNKVGSRISRAKPTATTVKIRAPRIPIRRAARREKTMTVIVIMTKRPRGRPVRAIWERMKDYPGKGELLFKNSVRV